jgi:Histidine kinase
MDAAAPFLRPALQVPGQAAAPGDFLHWLLAHRGAVAVAGLLAFAAPVTFFVGAMSVMREPDLARLLVLGLWWLLYAVELWLLLLVVGHAAQRLAPRLGRWAGLALWTVGAAGAALCVNLSTGARASILIEQGVVQSAATMHAYSFTVSFTMALLYFAHLRRSRQHESASARLMAAQRAQREARLRTVQARLQAVQARIDPRLLFEMLDAVRLAYAEEPERAERLLDELVAFLRASLPRLRNASSSIAGEAELARAYIGLRSLAGAGACSMVLDVAPQAMHARFPPGVLLPLLDDGLRRRGGPCTLRVGCAAGACCVALGLPAAPSEAVQMRVLSLLADLYGSAASLDVDTRGEAAVVTIRVPHEFA